RHPVSLVLLTLSLHDALPICLGWFTRSVSRSYRSFRAFPPAVKKAAAAPARTSGRARLPHAWDPTATIPPIPTPTAAIAQLSGRARRRSPAMPPLYGENPY